jgi:PadR family transcriptional regulator, regulatory protein PadR
LAVVRIDKDLVAASARLLVLAMLAEGESYGYAILKRVHALSGGELEWTEGMLYPLLHRLRHLGYVTAEWRTTPEGRRRQYYVITDEGRAALADQQRQWVTVTRALSDVWPKYGGLPTAVGAARAMQRVGSQTAEWPDHVADAVGGHDHEVAP